MVKSSKKNRDKNKQHNGSQSSTRNLASSPNKTDLTELPNKNQQAEIVVKPVSDDTNLNLPKTQTHFSIENEIAKIKVSIPLAELVT